MSPCLQSTRPALVGDPVDTSTGAAVDETLDFRLTGPLEFWWVRHYDSSLNRRHFSLGWGHSHGFDRALHLDIDGLRYVGPLGRVVGFPPLLHDGEAVTGGGHTLRRVSSLRYELHHHGEPAMEFEFGDVSLPARLRRIFRGNDEIRFGYGAAGRWETVVDSVGRVVHVTEDADGRILGLTLDGGDEGPHVPLVWYGYDERGNLVETRDSSGYGFACAYDAENRMVRRTGRKGFSFQFAYDDRGRCVQSSGDNRMHEVSLAYDASGRVTSVTRADGGTWTYVFDELGTLTKVVDALGGVRVFVGNEAGRVVEEVDANGNATKLIYDAAGAAVAKITPFGHRTRLPEDPNAPDPHQHRAASNPAEYEYGRLIVLSAVALPDASEAAGLPIAADARANLVVRSAGHPRTGAYEAQPLGPLWWPKPRQGRVFSDLGKLVRQDDEWGRSRHWKYDASGNVMEYIDFDGGQWWYDCGNWHLRLAEANPLGATVAFSYYPSGQVAGCLDAGGTVSEYGYDANDHLVEVRRHGRVRDYYVRDAVGNLVAKHAGDGRPLLQIEIGPGNVPVRRALASGDEHTLEYDALGRCVVAATGQDRIELGYDVFGNRCSDRRNGRGVEHHFRGWRAPDRSVFLDRFVVCYDRRDDGTLVITGPGRRQQSIRVHKHGVVERGYGNGSREVAQYDVQGRCLFKFARSAMGRVWRRRFEWSGEGELRRVDDSRYGEILHEYDAAHRLRRRSLPRGRVEEYVLDAADNLLRQPGLDGVRIEPGNRVSAANGFDIRYNDRDHVAARDTPEGEVRYTYDSRDQLVRIEAPSGAWEAEYDAHGRRVRKRWAGQTTEYFWNTDQLVGEVQSDGRLRVYVYADPLALTPLAFLDCDAADAPPESGRWSFVLTDQIGTPCVIEDESGTEVWRARVDPYGRTHVAAGGRVECNLRFSGHYFDAETGLHYNRFRYYDPVLGRYLQSDPWGLAGGYNLYAYRTNPLLSVDVRGRGDEDAPPSKKAEDDAEATPPPPPPQPIVDETPNPPPVSNEELWKAVFKATNNRQVTEGAIDPTTGQPVIAKSAGGDVPPVIAAHIPDENLVPGGGDPRGKCGMPRAVQGVADANGGQLPPGPITVTQGGFRTRPENVTPDNPNGVTYKAPCENCQHIADSHPQIQNSGLPPGVPEGLQPGQEVPFTPPPGWAD